MDFIEDAPAKILVAIQVIPKTVPLVQRLVINRRNDPLTGRERRATRMRRRRSKLKKDWHVAKEIAGKPTIRWGRENNDSTAAR